MSNTKWASAVQSIRRLSKQGVGQREIARKLVIPWLVIWYKNPVRWGRRHHKRRMRFEGRWTGGRSAWSISSSFLTNCPLDCPADESSRISATRRVSGGAIPA